MSLINTYEEYKNVNKELIGYVEQLIFEKFEGYKQEEVIAKLNLFLNSFEKIKEKSDTLVVDENNANNLKDLQYMIVSGLFLISELTHFYKINELERFKMRAVNYINNNRRNEVLNK